MRLWQLLSLGRRALALSDAVARETGTQRVIVLDDRVARALSQAGHNTVRAQFEGGRLSESGAAADGVVVDDLADTSDAIGLLLDCSRVVRPGGFVIVAAPTRLGLDHGACAQLCGWFLHAGLVDLRQERRAGVIVTTGRVRRA